jgi:hypothetical protein
MIPIQYWWMPNPGRILMGKAIDEVLFVGRRGLFIEMNYR